MKGKSEIGLFFTSCYFLWVDNKMRNLNSYLIMTNSSDVKMSIF